MYFSSQIDSPLTKPKGGQKSTGKPLQRAESAVPDSEEDDNSMWVPSPWTLCQSGLIKFNSEVVEPTAKLKAASTAAALKKGKVSRPVESDEDVFGCVQMNFTLSFPDTQNVSFHKVSQG